MIQQGLKLKILLPSSVFQDRENVLKINVETTRGALGILPNRLDMVASIIPGILTFEIPGPEKFQCAIDEGILVKTGFEVLISVRHAMKKQESGGLREAFLSEFRDVEEREKGIRTALAKLESGFIRGLTEIWHRG